ncbi:hypothetical protein [Paenibacillus harenae]|uniref:Glycosyltransferase n=1 Tax=Paenibacillus harenae TaxID=306543 RepID=A0ABT9UC25_PAEHA|nr:hypothetical protein [Paenibacillus harenae]MDQ0116546.1 hypothetical protein [Paenibacillus harenae]
MLELLLLIIGCYIAAALSVHLAYWIRQGRKRASKHYVLIADRDQPNMEWYMRSLMAFSRQTGNEVRVTVVDNGASAETLAIVDRMARKGSKVTVHEWPVNLKPSRRDSGSGAAASIGESDANQLMWMLQAEGIVKDSHQAVLIDLQNPADLSKMPF